VICWLSNYSYLHSQILTAPFYRLPVDLLIDFAHSDRHSVGLLYSFYSSDP